MKKITFVKERRENMFGIFEDVDSVTADYILEQDSDSDTVYLKVWNKFMAISKKDIISIE